MARRLSDAILDSVCDLCTEVAFRGIAGNTIDEDEQENPRGFGQAVFDGLCTVCTKACSAAFSTLAQRDTANQPDIAAANIDEREAEAQQPPTRAQIRAQQVDRFLAYLQSHSPLAPVPEQEEGEPSSAPGPAPSSSSSSSFVPDGFEPPVSPRLDQVTPVHMWQGISPSPGSAPQQPLGQPLVSIQPWDTTNEYPLKYGRLQADGERIRHWIEDPNSPDCFINQSTLTIEEVESSTRYIFPPNLHGLLEDFQENMSDLGYHQGRFYWSLQLQTPLFRWIGVTGPGVIIMRNIMRRGQTNHPISDLTKALYTRNFDIETLNHVYFQDVVNAETAPFVRRTLYSEQNSLSWPLKEPQTWEYGTPEYDGILGSRIGKIVGYLVLCSFPRGTRRVARIVTWTADPANYDRRLQMRFDIESVSPA